MESGLRLANDLDVDSITPYLRFAGMVYTQSWFLGIVDSRF
jgi:hypothetical protein